MSKDPSFALGAEFDASAKLTLLTHLETGLRRPVVLASEFSPPLLLGNIEGIGHYCLTREPGVDPEFVSQLDLQEKRSVLTTPVNVSKTNAAQICKEVLADIDAGTLVIEMLLITKNRHEKLQQIDAQLARTKKQLAHHIFVLTDVTTAAKGGQTINYIDTSVRLKHGEVLTDELVAKLHEYSQARNTLPYPPLTVDEIKERLGDRTPEYGFKRSQSRAATPRKPDSAMTSRDDIAIDDIG